MSANKLKTAKWLLAVAVFFFVAKPFIGFCINPSNTAVQETILIKSFTKRKHDYVENSNLDAKSFQKKLADPIDTSFLLFTCLLCILFPLLFSAGYNITNRFIQKINRGLIPHSANWLINSQLII